MADLPRIDYPTDDELEVLGVEIGEDFAVLHVLDSQVTLSADHVRWLAMIGMPEAWRAVRPERELWRPPAAEEGADAGGGPAPAARHPTDGPDGQGDLFTGAQEG